MNIRVIRVELMISTWKVEAIPLNYTRYSFESLFLYEGKAQRSADLMRCAAHALF